MNHILSDHYDELCDKASEIGVDWAQTAVLIRGPGQYTPVTFRAKDRNRSRVYVQEGDGFVRVNFHTFDDGGRTVGWSRRKDNVRSGSGINWPGRRETSKTWLKALAFRQETAERSRSLDDREAQKRPHEEGSKHREDYARKKALDDERRRRDHAHAHATWEKSLPARPDHPYLRKKFLSEHLAAEKDSGIRETTSRIMYGRDSDQRLLMIPFVNSSGERVGYQMIDESGGKWYTASLFEGQYKGAIGVFGPLDTPTSIFVAEGYGTGSSVRLATGATFLMSRDAGNLEEAALRARAEFPGARSYIVGDNDVPPEGELSRGNVGMYAAVKAGIGARMQVICLPLIDGAKTDAADILAKLGAEGLAEILKDKGNRIRFKNTLDGIQYLLRYAPARDHEDLAGRLAAAMMHASALVTAEEIWERYRTLVMQPLKKATIMQRIKSVMRAPADAARKLTELNADVYMLTEAGEAGHPLVPLGLLDLVLKAAKAGNHIVLRAPMGTGKTERLVKALIEHFDRFVYLCHRISLSLDAAPKLGLINYRDMDSVMVQFMPKFVGSVMSICSKRFRSNGENTHCKAGLLVIDEASKLVGQCLTLGNSINKILDNTATFAEAVRSSGSTLLIDADANEALIEQIREIDDRPITVIDVTHPEGLGPQWDVDLYQRQQDLVMELMRCVRDGIKFRVVTDNRKWARTLEAYINQFFPGTVQLCVTREPSGGERAVIENLFKDINAAVVQYQCLIHTPVISSGVSITTPHFEESFGFFFGTVGATECLQMMGRDRTARDWSIWIRPTQVDVEEVTAAAREAEYTSQSLHTRLCHIHRRESIRERKDLDLLLPQLLQLRGHKVSRAEGVDEASQEMMEHLKEIAKMLEQQRIENIISVGESAEVSEEEYEALQKISLRTRDEEARVIAYEVLNNLGGELTAEDIEFLEKKQGVRRANVLECFLAAEAEASWCDRNAPDTGYGPIHAVEKRALLKEAIRILGLGENLDGEFDAVTARQLVAWTKTVERKIHAHFPGVISVRRETKYGVALVKRLLRVMGLDLIKRKTMGAHLYSVCPKSLERMMRYLVRRHEIGRPLIRLILTKPGAQPEEALPAVDIDYRKASPSEPSEYFLADDDDNEGPDPSTDDYSGWPEWLLSKEDPL